MTLKNGSNFGSASDSTFRVEFWFHLWLNFKGQNDSIFSLGALREKIESFWPKKLGRILVPPVTQLLRSKWLNFFSWCTERKSNHFDLKRWVEFLLRQKHLNWKKKNYCIGYPTGNRQSSIIAEAVNKQNISKLLLYKLYFKMILKRILKSFDFQCDFDFQITSSKMISILILNHLYLGDLILKSSTYDDFAHLWHHI